MASTTALLLTVAATIIVPFQHSCLAASLLMDPVERELAALKHRVNGSSASSEQSSVVRSLLDDEGHVQQHLDFHQLETSNGKLLKSLIGSMEKDSNDNNNNKSNQSGQTSPVGHLHLQLDLPPGDVHQTYDNDNMDESSIARLADVLPQLPLDLFSSSAVEKRDIAMSILKNNEYRNAARKDINSWSGGSVIDGSVPLSDDVRTAIEQELQRQWEMELEQELVSEQQRAEELLQVLYVTSRVLLNFLNKDEQGAALRALGDHLSRLQLQSEIHPSTLAAAAGTPWADE